MMLETILSNCNAYYKGLNCKQCKDCSYGDYCPHDCEKCLDYIHNPNHAPFNAPARKYDCIHMADVYTCKYSCRYTSEIVYALERCRDLRNLHNFKVLSFGCGPCTDLFAIDYLRQQNVLSYKKIEYRGVDYSRDVWQWIHRDISGFQNNNCRIKFFYQDACDLIHAISARSWTPNLIVFQYVFSDMQKHTNSASIMDFINTFAEYFNTKVNTNTYVVLNDVNLGRNYGGGREYFCILLDKLLDVLYDRGHFHNDNAKGYYAGGYPYGREFPDNANLFDWTPWSAYSPFDTCASAQMIIKKVVKE